MSGEPRPAAVPPRPRSPAPAWRPRAARRRRRGCLKGRPGCGARASARRLPRLPRLRRRPEAMARPRRLLGARDAGRGLGTARRRQVRAKRGALCGGGAGTAVRAAPARARSATPHPVWGPARGLRGGASLLAAPRSAEGRSPCARGLCAGSGLPRRHSSSPPPPPSRPGWPRVPVKTLPQFWEGNLLFDGQGLTVPEGSQGVIPGKLVSRAIPPPRWGLPCVPPGESGSLLVLPLIPQALEFSSSRVHPGAAQCWQAQRR